MVSSLKFFCLWWNFTVPEFRESWFQKCQKFCKISAQKCPNKATVVPHFKCFSFIWNLVFKTFVGTDFNSFFSLYSGWVFSGLLTGMGKTQKRNETWHSHTLSKEDLKVIWITWHTPWVLLTLAFFYQKSANFTILKR